MANHFEIPPRGIVDVYHWVDSRFGGGWTVLILFFLACLLARPHLFVMYYTLRHRKLLYCINQERSGSPAGLKGISGDSQGENVSERSEIVVVGLEVGVALCMSPSFIITPSLFDKTIRCFSVITPTLIAPGYHRPVVLLIGTNPNSEKTRCRH